MIPNTVTLVVKMSNPPVFIVNGIELEVANAQFISWYLSMLHTKGTCINRDTRRAGSVTWLVQKSFADILFLADTSVSDRSDRRVFKTLFTNTISKSDALRLDKMHEAQAVHAGLRKKQSFTRKIDGIDVTLSYAHVLKSVPRVNSQFLTCVSLKSQHTTIKYLKYFESYREIMKFLDNPILVSVRSLNTFHAFAVNDVYYRTMTNDQEPEPPKILKTTSVSTVGTTTLKTAIESLKKNIPIEALVALEAN